MADIAICSECKGEMDVTAASPFNRVVCPQCGTEVRVKVDFGTYLLERRLAYGGMSILFVARDQTLGREVALKVLNEDYSRDETRISQFEKEAELTALVSHPNVVRVYSVGRAFERFYIAMELIQGESLETLLEKKKSLPEREVLKIALQVVDGLRAARDSGLIHRDIKPGNILVDDSGTAKIVDFGLSLVTQGGLATASEIFATPYYAPPEALSGGEEDFRSDIYALGASLYHALCGKPPIESSSTNTKVLLEAKRNILPLEKANPSLGPATVALIKRAIRFERSERFSTYRDFLEAIEHAIAQEALPVSQREKTQAPARKRSPMPLAIGGVVLLGLLGMGAAILLNRSDHEPEAAAAPPAVLGVSDNAAANDPARLISKTYARAQRALRSGKFKEAEMNYQKLWRMKDVPEPTASWAGFEAGLAALLDGRSGDTRLAFQRLQRHLHTGGLAPQTRVPLEDLLKSWDAFPNYVLPNECPTEAGKALITFARALKNWEQGDLNAASYFQCFSEQTVFEQKDWLKSYQTWAQKLVADAELLKASEPNWDRERTPEQVEKELANLRAVQQQLATQGRAQFTLKCWQEWLEASAQQTEQPDWESAKNTH